MGDSLSSLIYFPDPDPRDSASYLKAAFIFEAGGKIVQGIISIGLCEFKCIAGKER